jgi:hypothetical protein
MRESVSRLAHHSMVLAIAAQEKAPCVISAGGLILLVPAG